MYYIDDRSSVVLSNNIMLTGACRSGTSMMANLLHTCEDVEFAFEPPMLRTLIPMIDVLENRYWKLLFDSFLFEEFLMQALDGRRLNFNQNDDSSIFKVKLKKDIDYRIEKKNSRRVTYPVALGKKIGFKLPDMTPWIKQYRHTYTQSKIIVMLRNPESVIHSLLRMMWFRDEFLNDVDAFWLHKSDKPPYLPFWLPQKHVEKWKKSNELERSCYYYILMYENIVDHNVIVVDYDKFVKEPASKFGILTDYLGVKSGKMTNYLLKNVKEPDIDRSIDFTLISEKLYKDVMNVYESVLSRSI